MMVCASLATVSSSGQCNSLNDLWNESLEEKWNIKMIWRFSYLENYVVQC